jgi:two-component system invasion response regulator UvrY
MRILIADDNAMVRSGVRGILSSVPDREVCGEAGDCPETLQKARELLPDLVLLDISMPGKSGLETARLLRQELPKIKIIIMSQHDPIRLSTRAIEAGAQACVEKSRLGSELLVTIESIWRSASAS